MHSWSEPGASALTVALSVLSSLLVGIVLVAAPWTPLWELNSLIQSHPTLRSLALSPFTRGAVTGLGLVNLLLALAELRALFARRTER